MKYGIISDVHSNFQALKTVLNYLEKEGIDRLLCAGDVVGYGPRPNECINLLRDWNVVSVRGNHDQVALKRESSSRLNRVGKGAIKWTRKELTGENKEFLAGLNKREEITDGDSQTGIQLLHGAPMDPTWTYITDQREAYLAFRSLGKDQSIVLFGHTHLPRIFAKVGGEIDRIEPPEDPEKLRLEEDNSYLINPGSVGQPRDGNWRTSFAVLETGDEITIDHKRLEYAVEKTRNQVLSANLPQTLADRLLVGK